MSTLLRRRVHVAAYLVIQLLAVGALAQSARAMAPGTDAATGLAWTNGYTMIVLEEGADAHQARRLIQARGGSVALILPPRVLTGWIAPALDADLVGHAGIQSIHRQSAPSDVVLHGESSRLAARFFDRVVQDKLPSQLAPKPQGPAPLPPGSDAFSHGEISSYEVLENLRRTETNNLWKLGSSDAIAANSDYMVGTVTVSLFFVESDGSGSDPDQFDWTTSDEQDIYDEAIAGLSWWSNQANQHADCWVTFVVQAHFATADSRTAQAREPVLHDSTTYPAIVSDVLSNFGYSVGSHISRATAYNTTQRLANDTDWAYSAFIAANPTGADSFTDGFAAWAFLGGPYTALLQRSFTWEFRRVFAHETGHIFGACDEYYVEGYGGCNGCGPCWTTGVDNGNCEECNSNSVACMMKSNTWNLCGWTPGQLGWWRTPCIAGQLPAPVVDGITPASMWQAQTGTIEVQGDYFNYGSTVDLGEGIVVVDVEWVSSSLLRLQVDVDTESPPGNRDMIVVGPDGGSTTATQAFSVQPTRVHYVSAFGSNEFPFDRPTTASADLSSVLAIASSGDTLRLVGGTYGAVTLQKSLVLEGGWANDFSLRLPESLPTILQASHGTVMRITGVGSSPVLDGLVLRGGKGVLISSPQLGNTSNGGGAFILDATPLFRKCTFEDNQAGTSVQNGLGGGVFLWRGQATFEDCTFRNNTSGRGAALFALEASVVLRGNYFVANQLQTNWGPAWGGAIGLHSSTASLQDDLFESNAAAATGGAIHASDGSAVTATGVTLRSHMVSGDGGGLWSNNSAIQLFACELSDNQSGNMGGGMFVEGGSLEMHSTLLTGNQAAILGGAIYTGSNAPQLHNLAVSSNNGGPASGVYMTDVQPGAALRNSIIGFNTLGAVIFASGVAPDLDWNVYWQNGGLDVLGATLGANDQLTDPLWVDRLAMDLHLSRHSPCLDGGDAAVSDPDGSRSDRGAHGGPHAQSQAPPRTVGLQTQATRHGTRLNWNPSQATDVAGYLIYRGAAADFQPDVSNFVKELAAPTTSWEDVQPAPGVWYKVAAVDQQGHAGGYSLAAEMQQPTDASIRRERLELAPIYPNPTNPGAWVEFSLPNAMPLQLIVYDARGRRTRQLAAGPHAAGRHRFFWDGRTDAGTPASSGVYWVRMQTTQKVDSRKLILVR